jgi:hypothetical protein
MVMHREANDRDLGEPSLNPPRRFDTIHHRHVDIHQHQSRLKSMCVLHRLTTVACLTHNLKSAILFN